MEEKKTPDRETPETGEQQLSEDTLKKASGGAIKIRPSDNSLPGQPGSGDLV